MILAGDIGGTRARFALLTPDTKKTLYKDVLDSQACPTFEEAVGRFLAGARKKHKANGGKILAASFGIAGPVVNHRVKTTNLPWVIDAKTLERELDIPKVTLLNDLVAVGLGAIHASKKKLVSIHVGHPKKKGGNVAVISAGTGLGEAAFIWDGETHIPCPTEGGHSDFAPQTPTEVKLWGTLNREYGHVSYERITSGSTIASLYKFFVHDERVPESKASAGHVLRAKDANVAVVELALTGKSEAAMRAIELWASVYGAEAGNLALKFLATSGVYICGGASAHLAVVLEKGLPARKRKTSPFIEGFVGKGRMRPLLEQIPVAICLEPFAGLLGAAAHAGKVAAATTGRKSR
jgi:glucokinase